MSENRKTADWQIIAALVLFAFLAGVGVYVGCYFALTKEVNTAGYQMTYRIYSQEWKASLFRPGAGVESWWVGHTVEAIGPSVGAQEIWLDLDYDRSGDIDLFSRPLPLAEDFIAEATARDWPQWEFYDKFGMPTFQEEEGEFYFLYECSDASVRLTVSREQFEQGIIEVVEGKPF